ncbi:hypothetical protein ACFO5X_01690 [Seohaeicola nanhaiensis]|uniref:Uncharacterized protein n=1 Tax=Seohaeicola nanhaiensis TaxID=1387282 RepID=A0ABV9KAZ0_9RHOB
MMSDGQQIRHDFAAWAASTAARSSKLARFNVSAGRTAIASDSRLSQIACGLEHLPEPGDFDEWHRSICETVQKNLTGLAGTPYQFGVSAKLVNVYLKALLISEFGDDRPDGNLALRVAAVHPPIDRSLLGALEREDFGDFKSEWHTYKMRSWSTFSFEDYSEVIRLIRVATGGVLWKIEKHWPGQQL